MTDIDSGDFLKMLLDKYGVSDDLELIPILKPILLSHEKFLEFCGELKLSPPRLVIKMIDAKMEVLNEPRVAPKLKNFFKKYGYEIDGTETTDE